MAARILITGATGTVGRPLVQSLVQTRSRTHGDAIVAGIHTPAKQNQFDALGIETVLLDYADPKSIRAALAGVTRLFLVTGYSVDMLVHAKNVLDAAHAVHVEHVVHLGAAGSESQPYPHLAWHAYVESYIQTLGFSYTHLRPRTYMTNVLRGLRRGSTVIRQFFDNSAVTWIDPGDIAAVAAAALLNPSAHRNAAYTLAAEALPLSEVASTLARATNIPFTYEPLDPARALEALTKAGMEPVYCKSLARHINDVALGVNSAVSDVNDTIEKVTGRPRARWNDFAQRHRDTIRRIVNGES